MDWADDLLTGIDEIDRQHQILFVCLARLEQAVSSAERWSAVHFALDEVSDFARIHFAIEEALLRLHGYPLLEVHIAEHRTFVRELGVIGKHSVRADVGDEMVKFLHVVCQSRWQERPPVCALLAKCRGGDLVAPAEIRQPEQLTRKPAKKQEEDDAQHQLV